MPVGDFDRYYSINPIEAWSRNRWSVIDPAIAVAFRQTSLFTPLIDWVALESLTANTGVSNPTEITTGREALPGHFNHSPIPTRAKYIGADYVDSRERRLRSRLRYGGKTQLESFDVLVNMWRNGGTQGFIEGILRTHLNNSIVGTAEKIARDALLTMGNIRTYAGADKLQAGRLMVTPWTCPRKTGHKLRRRQAGMAPEWVLILQAQEEDDQGLLRRSGGPCAARRAARTRRRAPGNSPGCASGSAGGTRRHGDHPRQRRERSRPSHDRENDEWC